MRCRGDLKADNALHPAPERRLPTFDFQLLRVQLYRRQGSVRADLIVCSGIFGPQLEPSLASVCTIGEAVDCKTQVGQNLVIDDVVQEHGIRVEGLLRQDDAIIE